MISYFCNFKTLITASQARFNVLKYKTLKSTRFIHFHIPTFYYKSGSTSCFHGRTLFSSTAHLQGTDYTKMNEKHVSRFFKHAPPEARRSGFQVRATDMASIQKVVFCISVTDNKALQYYIDFHNAFF